MTWFYILAAVAAAVWLAASVCGGLALRRGLRWQQNRFVSSLVLASVALVLGYFGVKSHIRYSQTVNGRGWSVDSSWFFWLPLVLGALGLGLVLWRRFKRQQIVASQPPTTSEPAAGA